MAQTLKVDTRQAIIDAAKQEFMANGYDGASMRTIAAKANMTVGNLYRYFKNKEEINAKIVEETLGEFSNVLNTLSINSVSMEARVFKLIPDIEDIKKLMNEFSNILINMYKKDKFSFKILFNENMKDRIVDWFCEVINCFINQYYSTSDKIAEDLNKLTHIYAVSIYYGLKDIFNDDSLDLKGIEFYCKSFLKSYVNMLDTDIRKAIV